MQRFHNEQVHPEWEQQGYSYLRAVWIECAEALDHYGWKWWMHQERKLDQVRLELVDIWHFGLSELIRKGADLEAVAHEMVLFASETTSVSFRASLEFIAARALHGEFDTRAFVRSLNALPMSLSELYGTYIGKNVLNRFRQEHGYSEGRYVKIWGDCEDNAHLAEIVRELDFERDDVREQLALALESRYRSYIP